MAVSLVGFSQFCLIFLFPQNLPELEKLIILLFLSRYSDLMSTAEQLSESLYFCVPCIEEILSDLQKAGLVDRVKNCYLLRSDPLIKSSLQALAEMFEDPLMRQKILDQVR